MFLGGTTRHPIVRAASSSKVSTVVADRESSEKPSHKRSGSRPVTPSIDESPVVSRPVTPTPPSFSQNANVINVTINYGSNNSQENTLEE